MSQPFAVSLLKGVVSFYLDVSADRWFAVDSREHILLIFLASSRHISAVVFFLVNQTNINGFNSVLWVCRPSLCHVFRRMDRFLQNVFHQDVN